MQTQGMMAMGLPTARLDGKIVLTVEHKTIAADVEMLGTHTERMNAVLQECRLATKCTGSS